MHRKLTFLKFIKEQAFIQAGALISDINFLAIMLKKGVVKMKIASIIKLKFVQSFSQAAVPKVFSGYFF
ncbi:hypothetical protein B14911_20998 [Bacillus sp. NRRL B-14911]|nr:hypothetical protein B14911_20998 [Bacillus sp. NRRL B-14911]